MEREWSGWCVIAGENGPVWGTWSTRRAASIDAFMDDEESDGLSWRQLQRDGYKCVRAVLKASI